MAFKRKKGVSKRYVAKRRPISRRVRRKLPYGSYKKRGRGRRSTVTVQARSLSVTCWMGNPVGSDYIGAYIKPWVGGTDVLDNYVYMTSGNNTLGLGLFSMANLSRYRNVFEYMFVSSMWIKYTPAITEGNVGNAMNEIGLNGGAVAGTITMMCSNDLYKDSIDYDYNAAGLHSLKSNKRSTTFNIYKKCFMRWTPKLKIDTSDGEQLITKYIPFKVQLDTDNWITGSEIGVMIQSQVPVEAGVQYTSINPTAGGNWPSEGKSAVIGKFEIGATCHFYGLRI